MKYLLVAMVFLIIATTYLFETAEPSELKFIGYPNGSMLITGGELHWINYVKQSNIYFKPTGDEYKLISAEFMKAQFILITDEGYVYFLGTRKGFE